MFQHLRPRREHLPHHLSMIPFNHSVAAGKAFGISLRWTLPACTVLLACDSRHLPLGIYVSLAQGCYLRASSGFRRMADSAGSNPPNIPNTSVSNMATA